MVGHLDMGRRKAEKYFAVVGSVEYKLTGRGFQGHSSTFNLLNKVRFLKKEQIKSISDIASDFASRSYNMRMFNHAVIITNDSISYFANFLYY
ncbi:unnamed protein product [Rhizophagus irregularis]|nr:unnamed protein product [Rhizophagus irregularis]